MPIDNDNFGPHNEPVKVQIPPHHPWVELHKSAEPIRVSDQLTKGSVAAQFNSWLAVKVTKAVGSMWCAYIFAAFDLLSLPAAIRGGIQTIVSWVAQTFLQLVLLSIIMVGQDVQAKAADKRSEQTYQDAEALLHETQVIDAHLASQDERINELESMLKDSMERISSALNSNVQHYKGDA